MVSTSSWASKPARCSTVDVLAYPILMILLPLISKALSDSWLLNRVDKLSVISLFRAGHLDRIANAVLPLKHVSNRTKYLTALTSGSLDLLQRQKSHAKNILWELELWSILQRRSFDAILSDPPDIVVTFEGSTIGIACKKLYSEKHVQNVLSEAVAQIEAAFDFGIVAVNLDDLVPQNAILSAPNQETMSQVIVDFNARFLELHERHFRKYLASGRLIAALVSTAILADVYRRRTRFNNAWQSTIWTIPGLPADKHTQLCRFRDQLMS